MWNWLFKNMNLLGIAGILGVAGTLIIVACYYRKIGNLIDRLWAAPTPSDTAKVAAQSTQPFSYRTASYLATVEPASREAASITSKILSDINSTNLSADEKLRRVCTMAANATLFGEFEQKFRMTYKSQLEALSGLRQKGPHALDEYYRAFIERVKANPNLNYAENMVSFDKWVGFLSTSQYPYVELESGIASITDRGDAFMDYLAQTGYVTTSTL